VLEGLNSMYSRARLGGKELLTHQTSRTIWTSKIHTKRLINYRCRDYHPNRLTEEGSIRRGPR